MVLMAWYVLFMVIGDFAAYFIGLAISNGAQKPA